MESIKNFSVASIITYIGLLCSDSTLSPDVIELLKVLISGVFGLLSSFLISLLSKKMNKDKKTIKKIIDDNKENQFNKFKQKY